MKRTGGKNNADVSKRQFWLHYRKNVKDPVERKVFDKVFRELFEEFARITLEEAGTVKLMGIGDFRIRAYKPKRFDKDGNLKKKALRPDWKKTWELWRERYPDTPDEKMKEIENKPILYHMNAHSDGYVYEMAWEKITATFKGKSCYQFVSTRANNRKRKELIMNGMSYYE